MILKMNLKQSRRDTISEITLAFDPSNYTRQVKYCC